MQRTKNELVQENARLLRRPVAWRPQRKQAKRNNGGPMKKYKLLLPLVVGREGRVFDRVPGSLHFLL